MFSYEHTSVGQSAKTWIHYLSGDNICRLEDLLSALANMDRFQERIEDIHTVDMLLMWIDYLRARLLCYSQKFSLETIINKIASWLIKTDWEVNFGWLGFYGISSFVGYLTPNPFLCKWSVLFQTIQFSISMQFKCKYSLIVKNLSISSYSV